MEFKTKDLLVTVVPKAEIGELEKACILRTAICLNPTFPCKCSRFVTCWWGCSRFISCFCSNRTFGCELFASCGRGGSACDPTDIPCFGSEFVVTTKEDLVTLRSELQDTLKRLDEIERGGLPATGFSSKAEAESVEKSLSDALEQVRAAKKGLK